MQHAKSLRHGEVVIHRHSELVGHDLDPTASKSGGVEPAIGAREKDLDAVERSFCLDERTVVIVDGGSVVCSAQEVPHDDRRRLLQEFRGKDGVAERLRHLLVVHIHEPVVHPVGGERVPGGRGLRELVLVVGEPKIEPSPVDVECRAEVAPRHRRALDVPAGPSIAPRRRPRGIRWLIGLVALPQREIPGVALGSGFRVRRRDHLVGFLAGQRTVGRPARGVEVHVAVCRIGVSVVDESLDDVAHLADRRGRARLVRRRQDAQGRVPGGKLQLEPVRESPPGLLAIGRSEDLVVNVGHIAHECHIEAAVREPATPEVVDECRAQVADVRARLRCGSTDVDADPALNKRNEVDLGLQP